MIPTPAAGPASRSAASRLPPLVPVALLLLALGDLRVELQLLFDHLTLTSLLEAVVSHPLAVAVLLLQPSLWRHYRRRPHTATADPS